MDKISTGEFFGEINRAIHYNGLHLTDTEYTHDQVDWHYHENMYFTFLLQGKLHEGNKRGLYECKAGDLLLHNWEDAHYNIKPPGYARGFHVEIDKAWVNRFDLQISDLSGSVKIESGEIRLLFYRIFTESFLNDAESLLELEALVLEVFDRLKDEQGSGGRQAPGWFHRLTCLLNEEFAQQHTLLNLSAEAGVHPVHVCRTFRKYAGKNFGEYLRQRKVEHALQLLPQKKLSLTTISYKCGFADQSHFTRCFKAAMGVTPSAYRVLLAR